MDLFVINRYMGEEESASNSIQTNEATRLSSLKKHIEKRKRKLGVEKKNVDEQDIKTANARSATEDLEFTKEDEKKSKKDKVLLEAKEESNMSNLCEKLEEELKIKKKKKRIKTKVNPSTNDLKEEDESPMTERKEIDEIPELKRKKKKRNKMKVSTSTNDLKEEDESPMTEGKEIDEVPELKRKKKKRIKTKVNTSTNDLKEEDESPMTEGKEIDEIPELTRKKKKRRNTEIGEERKITENSTEISESIENLTEEVPEATGDSEESKTDLGFTVIGRTRRKKDAKKVEKSLPDWLAKPQVVDTDLSTNLLPVKELDILSKHVKNRLRELKITSLFPIQKAVIPTILNQIQKGTLYGIGGYRPSDICVSAPTGSGKTLAYVIPIVQGLNTQTVCLLQALVILPTKDLAFQVKQVFEAFVKGTGLKVGLASGFKTLAKEQESLVGQGYGSFSRINILVATPGRLVDHLSHTPHFTLQHLRFLVIDEADRLLDQSYHDWLNKVLHASYVSHSVDQDPVGWLSNGNSLPAFILKTSRQFQSPLTPERLSHLQLPLQKLLFSATMTQSPEKLAPLRLNDPVLFIASNPPETLANGVDSSGQGASSRYTVPHGLTEYMVICNAGEKPLVLLYLMTQEKLTGVLCFTSSLEATHRLYLLVKLFGGIEVAEYSSNLSAHQRHGILRDFRQGSIQLLICSDAMARGMDIDNVSYVISYDAPKFVKTYIHRVGRTARGGNEGTAFTLLHSDQVHHFKELIQKTGRDKIPKQPVKDDDLQPLAEKYQNALQKLEETVKKEKQEQGLKARGQEDAEKYLQEQLLANIGK